MPRPIANPSSWVGILTKLGMVSFPPFQLSEVVQPVAIVDSEINLSAIVTPPALGTPASAGELVAPAANTRLADTGALAAGNWLMHVVITCGEAQRIRMRRRNGADAADVWLINFITSVNNGVFALDLRLTFAANERLVVENVGAGGAGAFYQASIWGVQG